MFENKEGSQVPNIFIRTRADSEWQDVNTHDIFSGKTVIVFSLPGAFTPTCSSSHVPRYNELAPIFRQNGVDESSRPGESHPQALTDPDVNVSAHPALTVQP